MKTLFKTSLLILSLSLANASFGQFGKKLLEKTVSKQNGGTEAPEGEGIIKLYSDEGRSNEIQSFSDGTKKLYCRAYIWKARAKNGKSPYKPLEPNYCIDFREGDFGGGKRVNGINMADVKGTLDGHKSFSSYTKSNDYIDFEIDLMADERFVSTAVSLEEKEHPFTIRLNGECFKPLAEGVFNLDLSKGNKKYKTIQLDRNGDVTVPTCLVPNDTKIRATAKSILKNHYGFEVIKSGDKMYFYEDWVSHSSTERFRRVAVTRKDKDGNCHYGTFKLWSKLTQGKWVTYETNEWSMDLMKCENLK